ncbi:hypothetical protein MTO96_002296 [Rhipicephalus appendiculatus]
MPQPETSLRHLHIRHGTYRDISMGSATLVDEPERKGFTVYPLRRAALLTCEKQQRETTEDTHPWAVHGNHRACCSVPPTGSRLYSIPGPAADTGLTPRLLGSAAEINGAEAALLPIRVLAAAACAGEEKRHLFTSLRAQLDVAKGVRHLAYIVGERWVHCFGKVELRVSRRGGTVVT